MRIPGETITQLVGESINKPVGISGETLSILRPYMSIRIFSSVVGALIMQISSGDRAFMGILSCYDDESIAFLDSDREILGMLVDMLAKAVDSLPRGREGFISDDPDGAADWEKKLDHLLEADRDQGKASLIVAVDLARLLESILSAWPDAEPFRLQNAVVETLRTITPTRGAYIRCPGDRALLVLPSVASHDRQVMTDHLGQTLSRYFSDMLNPRDVFLSVKRYPDDGETARQLFGDG